MRLFESVQPTLTNEKIKKILKPLLSGNLVKNFLVACITVGIVFFCAIQVSAQKEQFKVTFINPGISDINDPTGGFWLSVSAFMSAAAKDLNIDLEILYSERDHVLMQKQAQEVARRKDPPYYLLVVNEKLSAGRMIEVADADVFELGQ